MDSAMTDIESKNNLTNQESGHESDEEIDSQDSDDGQHRENSPITQSTPEHKLLSWRGWPPEKISPPHTANPVLSCLSGHSDLIVLNYFDVSQVFHECQICLRFYRILKVILEMAF